MQSMTAFDLTTTPHAPVTSLVPGGATTRSLRACESSLILAVLCKGAHVDSPAADA